MVNDDAVKKVIYKEKQDQMIYSTEKEIKELQEKKKSILEKYDREIKILEDRQKKMRSAVYFHTEDSFQVIAYLVSQIEGVGYQKMDESIDLYATAFYIGFRYPFPIPYKLVCLVRDNEKDIASEEIKNRFRLKKKQGTLLKDSDYYAISRQLGIPSEHYIQLACFKEKDGNQIAYRYKNSIWISDYGYSNGFDSYICDERYHYIIDFMNEVVNYRLEKVDFTISLDEMMELADSFIVKYRMNKKNKSLNLQKK